MEFLSCMCSLNLSARVAKGSIYFYEYYYTQIKCSSLEFKRVIKMLCI